MPRCIVLEGFAFAAKLKWPYWVVGADWRETSRWFVVHSNPCVRVPRSGLHVLFMLKPFLDLGAYVARSRRTAFSVGGCVRLGLTFLGVDKAAVQAV